jgi:succinate dehydrogenase / fumarate reductase cytochrome b subunit
LSAAAPAPPQRKDEPRMATRERPLSPHLQVYRWQITMTMSILHRVSGVILTVGAFALAWWLMAVASGGESYLRAADCLASPLGKLLLFGFSLALVYHLLNGIRHLLWDAGMGFEIPEFYRSGWTVAVLTVVLTAAIWFAALQGGTA